MDPQRGVAGPVRAAGAVVFRPGRRVVLVHRPRYDDWSFPKGKLDPGEHATAAAVREVAEETGLHVRLGVPLGGQRYPVAGGRTKAVDYWVASVVGDDDVAGYHHEDEIDEVRWFDPDAAAAILTHPRDRATLAEALDVRRKTRALVVVRHGRARSRRAWRGDDRERPLLAAGEEQALALVPVLAAYDVVGLLTSPSRRCTQTLAPYAETTGFALEDAAGLSEEDATPERVRRIVARAVERVVRERTAVALCSHRPVLPEVAAALRTDDPGLDPGEMLVAHLWRGRVVATERHCG